MMRIEDDRLWDRVRSKWVALTPEERVRAAFVDYLIDVCGVSPALMATEFSVNVCGRRLRADIVVFCPRSVEPLMVVECKAEEVAIDQEVISQVCAYNSSIGARYVVLTNGVKTYAYDTVQKCYVDNICKCVEL